MFRQVGHFHSAVYNCSNVAGLAGWIAGGTVSQCYVSGAVTGDVFCWSLGGLVGWNMGTISQCHSNTDVSGGPSARRLGSLVGDNEGAIDRCYASGSVSGGDTRFAGLVGNNNGGTISHCYATGAVSGEYQIGGLVGWNYGTISQCYAVGAVSGVELLGGLVGDHYGGSINDSFWDTETSGQSGSAGGMGLTTSLMQQPGSYIVSGWDFNTVWNIIDRQGYPYFQWDTPFACGDLGHPYPPGDSNLDCVVDLLDFARLAGNWLTDVRPVE